jgi:large subunit ribosomal protein L13
MSHVRFSKPLWHLIDARNQVPGRLASQVVSLLRGKHKPTFSPNYDCGDYVVVINASEVKFTGKKRTDKLYTWHTGYPGGLKQKSVRDYLDDKPEEVKIHLHFCILIMKKLANISIYKLSGKLRFCGKL